VAGVRCSSLAAPFPFETLYGWLSRIGLLSHAGSDSQFLKLFMQYNGEQLTSIFPRYVNQLAKYSGIKAQLLLTQHTILPYFRPFIRSAVYTDIFGALVNSEGNDAYARFSLLANRIPEQKLLFYCPHCALCDLKNIGMAYWHREHQLPWVNVCYLHNEKLLGVARKRKVFVLPPQNISANQTISKGVLSIASAYAEQSACLLRINQAELLPDRITATYINELIDSKLATIGGQVKQAAWFGALDDYWKAALPEELFRALFSHQAIRSFPVNLIYQPDAQHHPLKHLLVIIHLFGSFEKFMQRYCSLEQQNIECQSSQTSRERVSTSKLSKLLSKLNNGESLRQAAKAAKVSIGFAKSTALQNGIEIERRAQRLFAFERKQILDWLKEGRKTQDIAKLMSCSTGAVEQILTQSPIVRTLREKLRFNQKRYRHRQSITTYLKKHPAATRGQIQSHVKASYYWCYKHDNEWLYDNLPPEIPMGQRYRRK